LSRLRDPLFFCESDFEISCGEDADKFSAELPLLIFLSELKTASAVLLSKMVDLGDVAAAVLRDDPKGGFVLIGALGGKLWRFDDKATSLGESPCFFRISVIEFM
jgi:hypothetical protein